MIDTDLIARAVNEQISASINDAVISALADPEWLEKVERQLLMYCQNRIMGGFSNLSSLPEIQTTIKQSVVELFDQGKIPGIDQFVTADKIQQAVNHAVTSQISSAINSLSADPDWVEKVEKLAAAAMSQRIVSQLQSIDVTSVVHSYVSGLLPELTKNTFRGIADTSQDIELSVMPGVVVAENTFVANDVEVVKKIGTKDLVVEGSLTVKGSINTDNNSWQNLSDAITNKTLKKLNDEFLKSVKASAIEEISQTGIEFSNVTVNGTPLLASGQLNKNIKHSSLETVGTLSSLDIKGNLSTYDTLFVVNNRVGINTANPENALTVWDDEICVTVGKQSKDTAFIGTAKPQRLELGINRTAALAIDRDGVTTINKLKVGHNSITFEPKTPGYAGSKGDIVFNSDHKPGGPFAWICLGQYRWQEIKSA